MKVYAEATCDGYNGIKKGDRFEVTELSDRGYEEHLQSLLNKGYEELGDCGISFEIR